MGKKPERQRNQRFVLFTKSWILKLVRVFERPNNRSSGTKHDHFKAQWKLNIHDIRTYFYYEYCIPYTKEQWYTLKWIIRKCDIVVKTVQIPLFKKQKFSPGSKVRANSYIGYHISQSNLCLLENEFKCIWLSSFFVEISKNLPNFDGVISNLIFRYLITYIYYISI